jgi:hypothetical protein
MNYPDQNAPPKNPLSPGFRGLLDAVVLLAAVYSGAIVGCRLVPPASPSPGGFCGTVAVPVMILGMWAGMIVGAVVGLLLIRGIEIAARQRSPRSHLFRGRGGNRPGHQTSSLWDRELDGQTEQEL